MSPGPMPFQSDTRPGFRSPPGSPWASEVFLKTSLSLTREENRGMARATAMSGVCFDDSRRA